MAREPKKDFIRIYDHIWGDEDVTSMTKPAQLAFVYLTAWSKAFQKDGHFNAGALRMCDVTTDELQELLDKEFVIKTETGYFIQKWSDWQMTEAERQTKSEIAKASGALGGAAKRDNLAAVTRVVTDGKIQPEAETRLRELYTIWYERKPITSSGGPLRERLATLFENWVEANSDIEKFSERVMWRLRAFDMEADDTKYRYLGTLGNFLKKGTWLDQTEPAEPSEKPVDPGFES